MEKLICFDVDGTLIDNKSSWLTIIEGLGCPAEKVLSAYEAAMAGKISFLRGETIVADIFRASGKADKETFEHIFDNEPLKPGVRDLVASLKAKGYSVWLVSGAIDTRVGAVAKKIGAAGFYAHTSLEFDGQGILSKINYGGDQNPWKAEMVRKLAREHGVLTTDIVFVGDGPNDIDAFKLTGRGIAVYPYDEKLGEVAWKTVKDLSEIGNIV